MQTNGELQALASLPLRRSPRVPSGDDAKLGGGKVSLLPPSGIDFKSSASPARRVANTWEFRNVGLFFSMTRTVFWNSYVCFALRSFKKMRDCKYFRSVGLYINFLFASVVSVLLQNPQTQSAIRFAKGSVQEPAQPPWTVSKLMEAQLSYMYIKSKSCMSWTSEL